MTTRFHRTIQVAATDWHRTVLFVGSGLSAGSGVPTWQEFIAALLDRTGVSASEVEGLSILDQADRAFDKVDDIVWRRTLRDIFPQAVQPNAYHQTIANLPDPLIVTTNYDTLIEDGLRATYGTRLHVARTFGEFQSNFPGAQVVKIHGCITRPETMVVTRSQYDDAYGNSLFIEFLKHIFSYYNVIFLGFSLDDPAVGHIFGTSSAQWLRLASDKLPYRSALLLKDTRRTPTGRFRQTNVEPLEAYSDNLVFLQALADAVAHAAIAPLRLVTLKVVRAHEWSGGDFRIDYCYCGVGTTARPGVRTIGRTLYTDTADDFYCLNNARVVAATCKLASGREAKFAFDAETNRLAWRFDFSSGVPLGDQVSFHVHLRWEREYPPWREEFLASTLSNRPDGFRADGRWSDAVFLDQPTSVLEVVLLFPSEYPIDPREITVGPSPIQSPPPSAITAGTAVRRRDIHFDRFKGTCVRFYAPAVGRSYAAAWRFASRSSDSPKGRRR